jgi:hypothetical protein
LKRLIVTHFIAVLSLVSGHGYGTVKSIELVGRSCNGRSDFEPIAWKEIELSNAIRWQKSATEFNLPVTARFIEKRDGMTLWTGNATR